MHKKLQTSDAGLFMQFIVYIGKKSFKDFLSDLTASMSRSSTRSFGAFQLSIFYDPIF